MGSFQRSISLLQDRLGRSHDAEIDPSFVPVPRVEELRRLEGSYDTPAFADWRKVSPLIRMLMETNGMGCQHLIDNTTPKGEKLGKWLAKSHIPEKMISDAFNEVKKGQTFEITCRYEDILRMSETKHYGSCIGNNSTHESQAQRLCYLLDKFVALAVIRDSKGDFSYRRVIGIAERRINRRSSRSVFGCSVVSPHDLTQKTRVIRINKPYGNGPTFAALANAIRTRIDLECVFTWIHSTTREIVYRPELPTTEMKRYYRFDDACGHGSLINEYNVSNDPDDPDQL